MRIRDIGGVARREPLTALVAVMAVAPITTALMRALAAERVLLGDNAMIATRAHDVLTRHHPLLGTWSSASVDSGVQVNHPGPLLFDVLAPFVRLLGMHDGTVVGMAVLNGASVLAASLLVRRLLGRGAMMVVLMGALALEFIVGSALLVDPWNPHAMVFPFLVVTVATWGIALGDRRSIAWFVVSGSYCLQVHLGAAFVVPLLGVVAAIVGWRTHRRAEVHPLRPDRRWAIGVGSLALALWAQPVVETIVNGREGNLLRLLSAGGGGDTRIGPVDAMRFVSAVVMPSPGQIREGFMAAIPATGFDSEGALAEVATRGVAASLLSLAAFAALLVGLWWRARRSNDVRRGALMVMSGLAMLVAWLSMAVMPLGPFGLTAHQMRWMWPLGIGCWVAVSIAAAPLLARYAAGRWQTVRSATAGGGAVLLAAASLPAFVQPAGPAVQARLESTVAVLVAQLAGLRLDGDVLVDHRGTPLFDGTWDAVVGAMIETGIDVRVDDPALARHYGSGRLADGSERTVVSVRWGVEATVVPPGSRRLAVVQPSPSDPSTAIAVFVTDR
jgi:hypothetical protein